MGLEVRDSKGKLILGAIVLVCFFVGMLIGRLVTPSGQNNEATPVALHYQSPSHTSLMPVEMEIYHGTTNEDKWQMEEKMIQQILDRVDPENIRENLRYLAAKPHMAATPRDHELANHIKMRFDEAGFDSSELVPYNLYLSKPDPNNPNLIKMFRNGEEIFTSSYKEVPIHKDDDDPEFVHAFNAFTPAGTVTTMPGEGVVYVNYGRIEDFEELEELGVNITGHIALVRYGKIYRGNKIREAEKAGAKGIIIFSDPDDVAPVGILPQDVYDNSWWLPGTGMQRGATYLGDGDPLTPGWPSTEHAYRREETEADLHKIPSQPIGYGDALEILKLLSGDDAPADWQGGLPNITYKLGPTFAAESSDVVLSLSTHNVGKIEKSNNVIGIIKGSIEPDRYVMFGNHRDAWGYGASDPSSGTAQLLETARVFGTFLTEGWRPRRSLVFCSWGAEEFGMIGSTEWVEENIDKLQSRAVAYINTDTCVSGPMLHVRATPLMHDIFEKMTKMIPGVVDENKTLYDEWRAYHELKTPGNPEKSMVGALGSGSDYAPFSIFGGVPAADIYFSGNLVEHNLTIYPYYHTGYETFQMVNTIVDPSFHIHRGCGRLALLTLKYLADSSVIPYNITRFPEVMLKNLRESKNKDKILTIDSKYDELINAAGRFLEATEQFQMKIKNTNALTEMQIRALNDQMLKLEQIFLIPEGLPGRVTVRNAIFAPSQFDSYASDGFPGLSDLLYKIDELEPEERMKREKMLKRHVSDLIIMTDRAASFLKDEYMI